MKIQIGNEPYLDRTTGKPVEGRLSVYLIHSDTLAKTYTIEGNNGFVEAPNPVLLHGGLPDDSLFVEIGLYGLKIERYTGPEGQMSAESPDEYFEQIDYLEAGMDFDPQASSANVVDTIGDLEQANPDLKFVTVLWHDAPGDCNPRQYYWDAGAQDNIDGGYVVGSEVSDTGRWILLWADEILPCTVYGVTPNNVSNINLLLNYPATVGSIRLVTAPCVRFTAGSYDANFVFSTDKEIVFDGEATFPYASFNCPRVRVMGSGSSYIADFYFTAPDAEAHSSWFRTLQGFWHCNAKFLFCDTTNYFTSSVITSNVNLTDKVVMCNGRIPCTYANGVYFAIGANTSITGRLFSPPVDFVRIMSTGWGDGIFATTGTWDPGLINAGHHIQFDNVPDLDLFENADRWVKTMVERRERLNSVVWTDFTLDLQNRRLDNLAPGKFTEIRNGTFNRLTILNSGADITLRNVVASDFTLTCRYISLYRSDVFFNNLPSISAMWAEDSNVNSHFPWTDRTVQVIMDRCRNGIIFNRVTENDMGEALLQFTDCDFNENVGVSSKNLVMTGCKIYNGSIKIYPFKQDGAYFMRVTLENNIFNTVYPIEFTRVEVIDGWVQENCYDIIPQWKITGNTFLGNNEGLRCRYWQKRAGNYYTRTFLKFGIEDRRSIEYYGNIGKCPDENAKKAYASDSDESQWYWVELSGGSIVSIFKPKYAATRAVLDFKASMAYHCNSVCVGGNGFPIHYRHMYSNALETPSGQVWVYPVSHLEPIEDGDVFLVGMSVWGKVTTANPGKIWGWQFL